MQATPQELCLTLVKLKWDAAKHHAARWQSVLQFICLGLGIPHGQLILYQE